MNNYNDIFGSFLNDIAPSKELTEECGQCEKDFQTDEALYTPTLCPECEEDYDGPGDEYYES